MNADLIIDDLHPLLERLVQQTDAGSSTPTHSTPGPAHQVRRCWSSAKSPIATRETLDIAVIVPELHAARRGPSVSAC